MACTADGRAGCPVACSRGPQDSGWLVLPEKPGPSLSWTATSALLGPWCRTQPDDQGGLRAGLLDPGVIWKLGRGRRSLPPSVFPVSRSVPAFPPAAGPSPWPWASPAAGPKRGLSRSCAAHCLLPAAIRTRIAPTLRLAQTLPQPPDHLNTALTQKWPARCLAPSPYTAPLKATEGRLRPASRGLWHSPGPGQCWALSEGERLGPPRGQTEERLLLSFCVVSAGRAQNPERARRALCPEPLGGERSRS